MASFAAVLLSVRIGVDTRAATKCHRRQSRVHLRNLRVVIGKDLQVRRKKWRSDWHMIMKIEL